MNTAFVHIWGTTVGAVAWDDSAGLATFEYDSSFKNKNWDLSPLKMPLQATKNIFNFPELKPGFNSPLDTFKGLPGLLADVLPDKYGNQLINRWLAQNGRVPNSMNPVEMLCFIGTRGMGAMEFEPAALKESKRTFSIEIDSLVDIAQKMLSNKSSFTTNLKKDDEQAISEILKVGTSAGGARPKAVIAYNERTGEVRSGQTIAPKGFEHWLLKLDGVSDVQLGASTGYGRVEMAYYNMAIACGIDMMTSRLLEENGRAHFITKRFDREDGDVKHHIQTLCAIQHYDYNSVSSFSYEQLFQTMRELKLSYPAAEQMFRRMVFNVIARNCDDHTKNFAFRLKKNDQWELAPAYDLCHAYKPDHQWVSQHSLSINGKRKGISKKDLLVIGKSIRCKQASIIIEEIESIIMDWKRFANEVGVSGKLRDAIDTTIKDWN
ncbi:MAG: type II toxin-antitoxin system HipA family toxin [Chitinophagaceae bacterium]|jgi:serine/threonine-protein kinase HipA|nr:type II toxin-antitoxin system HipA family toxin [Chitinophagaceae bacterium]MCA6490721.1 type II toxin-antitoxin system HipA family toxin [Chitinophagaceae bacterium]MCA6493927.1 type II toxin-antitoxin system HipA family toxin [Chitinophagaceae bacterium]MCA6514710.1 type II toxin-antitoxin system HipA family toxin [Chitinophagaceae bacterium]MCE2972220.1 type II toxin-antitoxin system HipA family toxin [Sediminibacterium sp.]